MQLEHIQYEAVRGWARITLNRPERHNAMSNALLDELHAALWEADEDREIAAVLIRGAGPSFCSGYDLGRDLKHQRPRLRPEASRFRGGSQIDDDIWQMERNARVLLSIFDMHKPVVAQVHGNCLAGGMDLMMQCDMAIAAEDAIIGFPPVRKMGTPPMNMWLWSVSAQWAKRLLLTGDQLTGAKAKEIGLVLEAVPAASLDAECERLMDRLALIHPDLLSANKRSVNLAMELAGARTMQRLATELDARGHRSEAAREWGKDMMEKGLRASLEARDEPFGPSIIDVDR